MRFVKIRRNRIDDTNIETERIMAKIAVVGMGQGGMVAAIRLAKQGHVVTVFEKSKRGEVSYDWRDDIRADVFEAAGLPMPDSDAYCQKSKWLFCVAQRRVFVARSAVSAHGRNFRIPHKAFGLFCQTS